MDLQILSIVFYIYVIGGIFFYLVCKKVVEKIIQDDDKFNEFKQKSNFFSNKYSLSEFMNQPRAMVVFVFFYPMLLGYAIHSVNKENNNDK